MITANDMREPLCRKCPDQSQPILRVGVLRFLAPLLPSWPKDFRRHSERLVAVEEESFELLKPKQRFRERPQLVVVDPKLLKHAKLTEALRQRAQLVAAE